MIHVSPTGKIYFLPSNFSGLVSYGCCNKILQNGCLKTTEMHYFVVREARGLNQCVDRAMFPLMLLKEYPSFPLLFSSSLRCSLAYLAYDSITLTAPWLSSLCVSPCFHMHFPLSASFLLIKTPLILDQGPTLFQTNLILTNYVYNKIRGTRGTTYL